MGTPKTGSHFRFLLALKKNDFKVSPNELKIFYVNYYQRLQTKFPFKKGKIKTADK